MFVTGCAQTYTEQLDKEYSLHCAVILESNEQTFNTD